MPQKKGLSQEALGFEADLDRTYVSGIERGARNPTVVTIRRIAAAPGVAASRLMKAAEGCQGSAMWNHLWLGHSRM